ncbi:MAG: 3-methyl-2-oxobutanoate dehydrogenase subunit VorB [Thaumarchaeota archaeon]|nr:3-methyl-2-oxobutanoate dehydrogenase subunit VorB [Nitrososphaerota archaeon]
MATLDASKSKYSNNEKMFLEGNEALAYGAINAGLNAFFGYPITPSSEVLETLAKEFGNPLYPNFKVFLQASSELEAANMLLGAAATGALAMTATSSPGFSLMQETISYAAGMEIPFVVADANRAGPGLGSLGPEQGDMWKASKGGGHGDYRCIVLSAHTVAELAQTPFLAFRLAFKYRNPVIILYDSYLAKLKEGIDLPTVEDLMVDRSWTVGQQNEGSRQILNSLNLEPDVHEDHEAHLQEKFRAMLEHEQRAEEYLTDDAEVILVAYGILARLAKKVVNKARGEGLKAGLLRPIILWPPPMTLLEKYVDRETPLLVVELNAGQLYEDVKQAASRRVDVGFVGHLGGSVPNIGTVESKMRRLVYGRTGG